MTKNVKTTIAPSSAFPFPRSPDTDASRTTATKQKPGPKPRSSGLSAVSVTRVAEGMKTKQKPGPKPKTATALRLLPSQEAKPPSRAVQLRIEAETAELRAKLDAAQQENKTKDQVIHNLTAVAARIRDDVHEDRIHGNVVAAVPSTSALPAGKRVLASVIQKSIMPPDEQAIETPIEEALRILARRHEETRDAFNALAESLAPVLGHNWGTSVPTLDVTDAKTTDAMQSARPSASLITDEVYAVAGRMLDLCANIRHVKRGLTC